VRNRRAFYLLQAKREEIERNYHRRSDVESVLSALKRGFGENVRSKTRVGQLAYPWANRSLTV